MPPQRCETSNDAYWLHVRKQQEEKDQICRVRFGERKPKTKQTNKQNSKKLNLHFFFSLRNCINFWMLMCTKCMHYIGWNCENVFFKTRFNDFKIRTQVHNFQGYAASCVLQILTDILEQRWRIPLDPTTFHIISCVHFIH